MLQTKLSINGVNHFYETILKYLNIFLSVLATIPLDDNYKMVNIKNDALLLAFNVWYYFERGYKYTLINHNLVSLKKEGKYNSLTKIRECDYYEINFNNLCNFLTSLTVCTGSFIRFKAFKELAKRKNLPDEIRKYFSMYSKENENCLKEFDSGVKYKIEYVKQVDEDFSDYEGSDLSDSFLINKENEEHPVNRYNW